MKKPKFAHKIQQEDGAEPFNDAESAWIWAMHCLVAREDGARFVAGLSQHERPCLPDDLIVSAERLGANGMLHANHLKVLADYGRRFFAPDRRLRDEERAARLWDEALDKLSTIWRRKGILA